MQSLKATPTVQRQTGHTPQQPPPLGGLASTMFFAVPGILFVLAVHVIWPAITDGPLSHYEAFLLVTTAPLAAMLVATFIAVAWERRRDDGVVPTRRQRLRLRQPHLKDVGYAIATLAVGLSGYSVMSTVTTRLLAQQRIPLPDTLPALIDPRLVQTPEILSEFAGAPLEGYWAVPALFTISLLFNIAGEELWWRGYILPRQEQAFGRYAWLIHGLLWCGFHAFKWWDMLNILPICLAMAYFAQRSKSTWPPVIAHLVLNGLTLVTLLSLVAG